MDSYTLIGLVVGCAVGGVLFIIIVVIVCLVLREGWLESKRQRRSSRYRASSPSDSDNYYTSAAAPATATSRDAIGIAYNDPSMYAADVQSIRPESLWRRSIRHFRHALRLPSPPPPSAPGGGGGSGGARLASEARGAGSGKGFEPSLLNSNSSGSSTKKQMLAPTDDVELRFPSPSRAPQLQQPLVQGGGGGFGIELRHSQDRGEPPLREQPAAAAVPSLLPRTALPTVAGSFAVGGGYANADLERYYALLRPAGVMADGEVLYYCRTRDYYDLSDFFDIVAKKDGGWLVKPVSGLPPPSQQQFRRPSPLYAPVQPARRELSQGGAASGNGRWAAAMPPSRAASQPAPAAAAAAAAAGLPNDDDPRRRFASAYDLYRPIPPLSGGFGLGLMKRTLSQSDDLHRSAAADRTRDRRAGGGDRMPVVATPFGPAHRASSGRQLNGAVPAVAPATVLAETPVYEDIMDGGGGGGGDANTPPPPPPPMSALPKSDYRPAKPPRATMLIDASAELVDGAVLRRVDVTQPEARVHANLGSGGGSAARREIGDGIVATPLRAGVSPEPSLWQAAAAAAESTAVAAAQTPQRRRKEQASDGGRSTKGDSGGKGDRSKRSRRRSSSRSPSGSRSGRKAKSTETPVLVSSRVLHESSASLAAVTVSSGGDRLLQGPLSASAAGCDVAAAAHAGGSERPVEAAFVPPPPPPTPPQPLGPGSVVDAEAATGNDSGRTMLSQETRQFPPGLSAAAAAALASMPELNTIGSKDTVSTIKSYSRHIAEEFKFLDTYEGSTGTPASM